MKTEVNDAVKYIKQQVNTKPKLALILGSGLGDFADTLNKSIKIPTVQVPNYPVSTVQGHKGFLVFGYYNNIPVLAVQGRTHYYEGLPVSKVSFIVEILSALGIKFLIITNAAGSVNHRIKPGNLMLITDQVNFLLKSPLRGNHHFTDMSNPYSSEFLVKIEKTALDKGISIKKGVLWTSSGPAYETAAEIRMISKFGGDAVSMSTVPEVIMANRLGIKTIGISCITNFATGISKEKLTHREVTETAGKVKQQFISFVSATISDIFSRKY